jgi:uncharacterized membrane protein
VGRPQKEVIVSRFEDTVTVGVPVRVAYDQWTQFEDFPKFMEGVKTVEQIDDQTLRWTADVAGKTKTWTADITDQTPDERIAWKSIEGADNAGAVLFEPAGSNETRVTLRIEAEPEGAVESAGDALGFLERRVKGDLERFKEYVEGTGGDGHGWRGEIHGDQVQPDARESSHAPTHDSSRTPS